MAVHELPQKLFQQNLRLPVIGARLEYCSQADQHGGTAGRVIPLHREVFGALISRLRIGRSPSLNGHQGRGESGLHRKFVLVTPGGFGQALDKVQSLLKEFDGLAMCTPCQSLLRSVTEVTNGTRPIASFDKMNRQF